MSGETRAFARLKIYDGLAEGVYTDPATPTGGTGLQELINNINLSGPTASKADIDVTNLQSLAKAFISDLPDPGEVTLTGNVDWDDTNGVWAQCQADSFASGRQRAMTIEWMTPPTTVDRTCTFMGEVMELTPDYSPGQAATATIRIKVSGVPTFA